MNPSTWRREDQVALLLGTVLGIVAGLLVGYIQHDIHIVTLQQWFSGWSSIRWAVFGALFGAGLIYVQVLLRA
jgi:predicted ABC-type sugar transport system permease subunit